MPAQQRKCVELPVSVRTLLGVLRVWTDWTFGSRTRLEQSLFLRQACMICGCFFRTIYLFGSHREEENAERYFQRRPIQPSSFAPPSLR